MKNRSAMTDTDPDNSAMGNVEDRQRESTTGRTIYPPRLKGQRSNIESLTCLSLVRCPMSDKRLASGAAWAAAVKKLATHLARQPAASGMSERLISECYQLKLSTREWKLKSSRQHSLAYVKVT